MGARRLSGLQGSYPRRFAAALLKRSGDQSTLLRKLSYPRRFAAALLKLDWAER